MKKELKPQGIRMNCKACGKHTITNLDEDVKKTSKGWKALPGPCGLGPYCPACIKKYKLEALS
ncbi:MAG: hypothetical protein LBK08_10305 [Treponema sp.]|nr:hypothetical protein [Treponema sp.]